MARGDFLFTSESVTEGHPDKLADQISDGVLDEILGQDPDGRVACETFVSVGLVIVVGRFAMVAGTGNLPPQINSFSSASLPSQTPKSGVACHNTDRRKGNKHCGLLPPQIGRQITRPSVLV